MTLDKVAVSRRTAIESGVAGIVFAALIVPGPTVPAPPPTLGDEVTVVAVGDIVCGEVMRLRGDPCEDTSTLVGDADAVLLLGDIQYDAGHPDEYARWFGAWGAYRDIAYPVPGNHEYQAHGEGGFWSYWGDRAGKGYYATMLGPWRLYALDTNCSRIDCAAEALWLARDLDGFAGCAIAIGHQPEVTTFYESTSEDATPLFEVLHRYEVALYLAGHVHAYERIGSRIVAGTGGSHYAPGEVGGVVRLTLRPGGYSGAFVTLDGTEADRFGGSC